MAFAIISLYAVVMLVSGLLGALLSTAKNRDISAWTAWCFLLPPMLLLLALMPTHRGRRPRRLTLDEEDALY